MVPLAKLSASAKSLVPGGVDDHVRSSIAAAADVIARLLAAVETNKPRTTGLVLAEASEFCRGSRENRIALGDVRAPQVLTHLLAPVPGSDREQIQKAACATMANLAVDKELSLKIGAISGVFVGLSDLFSNRVCRPYAIAVIWTLAAQPDNRTKMPTTMAQKVKGWAGISPVCRLENMLSHLVCSRPTRDIIKLIMPGGRSARQCLRG